MVGAKERAVWSNCCKMSSNSNCISREDIEQCDWGVQFASPGWLTFTFSIRTPLCVFTNFINTNRCGLDSFEGRKQRSTAPTRHAHQLIGSFESCGNSS
eukprot:scaffold14564_cov193-Alexandrium_tamarense.AAC.4